MVKSSKEDILEKEEIQSLIDNSETDREKLLLITLIYTGMRVSEFCNMKKHWINWQRQTITIPNFEGNWKPKSKAGARTIPMKEKILRDVLDAWFRLNDDIPFERTSAFRRIKLVASRTDIRKRVYPHSLRATYASNLASKNFSPNTIQNVMGWSKLSTAESYIRGSGRRTIDEFDEKW